MCDPRLCNDSRARCATTIFLFSSSRFLSLSPRLVSRLYPSPSPSLALALARPRPRSPSPSLALALARPRPRPFPPSSLALAFIARPRPQSLVIAITFHHHRRLITSTRRHLTPTHRHLRFSRFSPAHSQALENVASLPLPLFLCTWEHPRTRHAGTVLHYTGMGEYSLLETHIIRRTRLGDAYQESGIIRSVILIMMVAKHRHWRNCMMSFLLLPMSESDLLSVIALTFTHVHLQ